MAPLPGSIAVSFPPRKAMPVTGGRAAADAVVTLMHGIIEHLSPEHILDVYNEVEGRGRLENMWKKVGPDLVGAMAEGTRLLATLWQSAWNEGEARGGAVEQPLLASVPEERLQELYEDKSFLRAEWLADLELEEAQTPPSA